MKPIDHQERFLTVTEAADMFSVSPGTIRAWIKDGKLAATKVGERGQWRVSYSGIVTMANAKYGESRR